MSNLSTISDIIDSHDMEVTMHQITQTDIDNIIAQIENMLSEVAGHTVVSAADMQNGLLDLMLSVKAVTQES